jgi:hypothetical protein
MMTTDGPLDGLARAIERAEEQDRVVRAASAPMLSLAMHGNRGVRLAP